MTNVRFGIFFGRQILRNQSDMRVIICSDIHEQGVLVAGIVSGLGASVEQVSCGEELLMRLSRGESCRVVIFVGEYSEEWLFDRVLTLRREGRISRLYVVSWCKCIEYSLYMMERRVDQLFCFPLNADRFRRRVASEFDITYS